MVFGFQNKTVVVYRVYLIDAFCRMHYKYCGYVHNLPVPDLKRIHCWHEKGSDIQFWRCLILDKKNNSEKMNSSLIIKKY
jgi:hypothetical protein